MYNFVVHQNSALNSAWTVQGVLEKSSFDVFFSPFDACNQKGLPKTPHILARVVHISIYFMCCTVELMFLLFF